MPYFIHPPLQVVKKANMFFTIRCTPSLLKNLLCLAFFCAIACCGSAQNRNFITGFSLGVGNSGFDISEEGDDQVKRIFYPTAGLHFQKRVNNKLAVQLYPNVGMSGNQRSLSTPQNNITKISTKSAFVNLAILGKYYVTPKVYASLGPEVSYLLWNFGSTYNGDTRLTNLKETRFFNRTNLLISSSIGYGTKIDESRKNAPIQIEAFWFIELRFKKSITNILSSEFFTEDTKSTILSFELVTGFSFASKARK